MSLWKKKSMKMTLFMMSQRSLVFGELFFRLLEHQSLLIETDQHRITGNATVIVPTVLHTMVTDTADGIMDTTIITGVNLEEIKAYDFLEKEGAGVTSD